LERLSARIFQATPSFPATVTTIKTTSRSAAPHAACINVVKQPHSYLPAQKKHTRVHPFPPSSTRSRPKQKKIKK
jgi:hypothetical protein